MKKVCEKGSNAIRLSTSQNCKKPKTQNPKLWQTQAITSSVHCLSQRNQIILVIVCEVFEWFWRIWSLQTSVQRSGKLKEWKNFNKTHIQATGGHRLVWPLQPNQTHDYGRSLSVPWGLMTKTKAPWWRFWARLLSFLL